MLFHIWGFDCLLCLVLNLIQIVIFIISDWALSGTEGQPSIYLHLLYPLTV